MVTILVLASLAGIVYFIYQAIPPKQEIYGAEQKEKNLISVVETELKDDVSSLRSGVLSTVVEIKKDI